MKNSFRKNIVWFTLILLAILLFFQVRWMVYSIHFQEKVFRNSVDLAMNKTIALLNQDQQVCSAMRQCMGCDGSKPETEHLNPNIWDQIHTSIDAELALFDINLDYDLFITTSKGDTLRNGRTSASGTMTPRRLAMPTKWSGIPGTGVTEPSLNTSWTCRRSMANRSSPNVITQTFQ